MNEPEIVRMTTDEWLAYEEIRGVLHYCLKAYLEEYPEHIYDPDMNIIFICEDEQ